MVRQIDALDVTDTFSCDTAAYSARNSSQAGVSRGPGRRPRPPPHPARAGGGGADGSQTIEYGERVARDLAAPLKRIAGGTHFTLAHYPPVSASQCDAGAIGCDQGWAFVSSRDHGQAFLEPGE